MQQRYFSLGGHPIKSQTQPFKCKFTVTLNWYIFQEAIASNLSSHRQYQSESDWHAGCCLATKKSFWPNKVHFDLWRRMTISILEWTAIVLKRWTHSNRPKFLLLIYQCYCMCVCVWLHCICQKRSGHCKA